MTMEPRQQEVGIAHLTRARTDLVEVRYHPGCVLTTKALEEVRKARQELMGAVPYGILALFPEDVDFELSAMHKDHLDNDRKEGFVKAVALVAQASMMEMILKLYFSYYPQLARLQVMDNEGAAREWLRVQLEEVARSGQ